VLARPFFNFQFSIFNSSNGGDMALVKLTTPLDEHTTRSLTVGDTVSITGRLYTGRDAVHHRIHEGTKPPVDLNGAILYHCGPVMVKEGDQWICKAAGPTTSSREEPYQHEVIRDYGLRGVIGKGGMGEKTLAACKEYGAVYLHAIGGAAQVCAASIKRVDGVDWMDLGSPEAIWHLQVEDFMAIVTMDSHGRSLHKEVFEDSKQRLDAMKA
jgi:tartrate/fumarate subfamily iron-sulfur-dependent hydro-lyase beta chain